ncbi:hypothetical protein QLR68_03910 [Micromonospora sp. DH15]|nr:hypothetical protein [Micromonospora sp. DH15]
MVTVALQPHDPDPVEGLPGNQEVHHGCRSGFRSCRSPSGSSPTRAGIPLASALTGGNRHDVTQLMLLTPVIARHGVVEQTIALLLHWFRRLRHHLLAQTPTLKELGVVSARLKARRPQAVPGYAPSRSPLQYELAAAHQGASPG